MTKEISSKKIEWRSDIGDNENEWNGFVNSFFQEEWDKLSGTEKALCLNYEEQLLRSRAPSVQIIKAISAIHAKYPDFHMGCLPRKKNNATNAKLESIGINTCRVLEFPKSELRTMDYSNFLPGEKA